MKKSLLLVFVGLFLSSFGFAQFTENFESQVVPTAAPYNDIVIANWVNYKEAGTRAWQARSYGTPVNKYAQLSAFNSTDASTIAWLITPGVNFNLTTAENLSFFYNAGYDNGSPLTVLYSNNYDGTEGGIATATWNNITTNFTLPAGPAASYNTLVTAGTMDVSAYTGTVYFAFKYTGSGTGISTTVQLDNISLTATLGINENVDLFSSNFNNTSNILNITENANVKVINLAGQVVINAESVNKVDMSALHTGMYIVSVQTAKQNRTQKVIVK